MLAARDRIKIQLVAVPFPGRPVSEESFSLKRISLGVSPVEKIQ
jgi:hypothetical protein